jgi:hypothetical protein
MSESAVVSHDKTRKKSRSRCLYFRTIKKRGRITEEEEKDRLEKRKAKMRVVAEASNTIFQLRIFLHFLVASDVTIFSWENFLNATLKHKN